MSESEDRMFREAEFLKAVAPLPVLSSGLRSRVLAAALEAQDRRSQGRRVLASALGLFAMLVGVAWMGPFSNGSSFNGAFSDIDVQISAASSARFNGHAVNGPLVNGDVAGGTAGNQVAGPSALSSLHRGQGLMSVMGDDWQGVEAQLQSRSEHFPRFQM